MKANFIISSGPIFDGKTTIFEHWVNGHQHVYEDRNTPDVRGEYTLNLNDESFTIAITGTLQKPTVKISAHAKNIWNKVHETLEDSPLKDFFLKLEYFLKF